MSDCQIDINYTNLVSSAFNNQYTKNFPQGAYPLKNNSIGVSSLFFPNSIFNVSGLYTNSGFNNNSFSYIWWDNVTYTMTLPDGLYEVADINNYLLNTMISNGHYLLDANGDYVVYLQIQVSPTIYAVVINAFPVPTSLPTDYTNPAGMSFPATTTTPQIVIPSTNNFGLLLGFSSGTYPSSQQTTNYSVSSDLTPQINPISVIYMLCDVVYNPLEVPSTIIYSFSLNGVASGTVYNPNINLVRFVPVARSQFTGITIRFVDQDFQPIYINDTRISVGIYIKNNDPLSDGFSK